MKMQRRSALLHRRDDSRGSCAPTINSTLLATKELHGWNAGFGEHEFLRSDGLQAISFGPRSTDLDTEWSKPLIELVDVNVEDLSVLRAAGRVMRPNQRAQFLGGDTGHSLNDVQDARLDRR
jgi:hypothetical protein